MLVLTIILVAVVAFSVTCVKIVPQAEARVVERLGSYLTTWSNGLHVKVPFIDRIGGRISLKEQVADFPPQPVITKDNVTMAIDTVVYYKVMDPKLYTYGVEFPVAAIENLTATTLRNVIGDMDLDTTLTSRDTINSQMRSVLDEATDVVAEGQKQPEILEAEGKKQANILAAEADKEAASLAADAERERQIREADGQAQAILKVQNATADGIRSVREAGADEAVLTLQALEALTVVADGKATKLIIPSNIQGIAGLAASLKDCVVDE